MHFDLHEGSPVSEYSRVEIYGLDYDKLQTLSGSKTEFITAIDNAGFTGHKIARLEYSGTDLYKALSNKVPTDPTSGKSIFARENKWEEEEGVYNIADVIFTPLPAETPADYATSSDYYGWLPYQNAPEYILPYQHKIGTAWDSRQWYRDDSVPDKKICRHFYFDNGLNFTVEDRLACGYFGTDFVHLHTCGWYTDYTGANYTDSIPYALNDGSNYLTAGGYDTWHMFKMAISSTGSATSWDNTLTVGITFTASGVEYVGIAFVMMSGGADPYPTYINICAIDRDLVEDNVYGTGEVGQGSWGPTSDTGGGGGGYDDSSDNVGDGSAQDSADKASTMDSALSAVLGAGFALHQILTVYDTLKYFYKVLFKTGAGSYLDRFVQSAYDPTSAIVALHLLPSKLLNALATSSHITAAGYDISSQMQADSGGALQPSDVNFPDLDAVGYYYMDKVALSPFFDAYPDFAPYTKCYLHLPYIGVQEIDINKIQYGYIQVTYYCEAITGNVAAHVWCEDRQEHRQYCYICTGNAAYKMPIYNTGANAGAISSGIAAISSAISGNIGGVVMGLSGAALGAAQQSVQASGNFGGNTGAIGDTTVWLEIIRPQWVQPEKYQKLKGLPSWVSGTISNAGNGNQLNGYTVISDIDLENVDATDWEKSEIIRLLRSGIRINGDL